MMEVLDGEESSRRIRVDDWVLTLPVEPGDWLIENVFEQGMVGTQKGRERNLRMTELLRSVAPKYYDSLNGLRWATFSVVGTSDWEDYASLSIRAMQLETLTDLERRVENLEGLLTEIRDILKASQAE